MRNKTLISVLIILAQATTFSMSRDKTNSAELHSLVKNPNVSQEQIEACLATGASLEELTYIEGWGGCTPLLSAVIHDNEHAVKALVKAKANIGKEVDPDYNPKSLFFASAKPARCFSEIPLGKYSIIIALYRNNRSICRIFEEQCPDYYAIALCRYLAEQIKMFITGKNNDIETLNTLVEEFADHWLSESFRNTLVTFGQDRRCEWRDREIWHNSNTEDGVITLACKHDNVQALTILLNHFDVDNICLNQYLMTAAKNHSPACCEFLAAKEYTVLNHAHVYKIALTEEVGYTTPLKLACHHQEPDIVRVFLDHGAWHGKALIDTNKLVVDVYDSALNQAIISNNGRNNEHAIVELLLQYGISPNETTARGTPLQLATGRFHRREMLKLLLRYGALVDGKAKQLDGYRVLINDDRVEESVEGWTALQVAARYGANDSCEVLLSHGADLYLKNPGQKTALHIALEEGHHETGKVLLESARFIPGTISQYSLAEAGSTIRWYLLLLKRIPLPQDIKLMILTWLPELHTPISLIVYTNLEHGKNVPAQFVSILPLVLSQKIEERIEFIEGISREGLPQETVTLLEEQADQLRELLDISADARIQRLRNRICADPIEITTVPPYEWIPPEDLKLQPEKSSRLSLPIIAGIGVIAGGILSVVHYLYGNNASSSQSSIKDTHATDTESKKLSKTNY